jgi:hypothetical protein
MGTKGPLELLPDRTRMLCRDKLLAMLREAMLLDLLMLRRSEELPMEGLRGLMAARTSRAVSSSSVRSVSHSM